MMMKTDIEYAAMAYEMADAMLAAREQEVRA
jgi:hypothetical protein